MIMLIQIHFLFWKLMILAWICYSLLYFEWFLIIYVQGFVGMAHTKFPILSKEKNLRITLLSDTIHGYDLC